MDKVQRLTRKEFNSLIAGRMPIGSASSESVVYKIKGGKILKHLRDEDLFNDIVYEEEKLLQFSDVNNKLYYFTKGVVYVDDVLEACWMNPCKGFILTEIDALSVNLNILTSAIDKFAKATHEISQKHIKGYDMKYNFMYDGTDFGAIDTIHYYRTDKDEKDIFHSNIMPFNDEIASFLVDFYFYEFVNQDNELNSMYNAIIKGETTDLNSFIELLRKKLSEYCGRRIIYLGSAEEAIRENDEPSYPVCPIHSLCKNSRKQQFIN